MFMSAVLYCIQTAVVQLNEEAGSFSLVTPIANPIQQHFPQSFNSVYVCDRSQRHMGGEVPPVLSQTCGAYLQGILYIFGGCDNNDYTNLVSCFRSDNIIT